MTKRDRHQRDTKLGQNGHQRNSKETPIDIKWQKETPKRHNIASKRLKKDIKKTQKGTKETQVSGFQSF